MFRDFLKIFWARVASPEIFVILTKNGPMFRDLGVKNGTHVSGFFVKNRPIWAAHPRIAFLWKYPPPGIYTADFYRMIRRNYILYNAEHPMFISFFNSFRSWKSITWDPNLEAIFL